MPCAVSRLGEGEPTVACTDLAVAVLHASGVTLVVALGAITINRLAPTHTQREEAEGERK